MTQRTVGFDEEQTVAGVEGRVAARCPAATPDVANGPFASSPWTTTRTGP